jgi:hypothetical protein
MTLSLEYLVRHEAGKQLRDTFPGRFFCISCLAAFVRPVLGTTYTKAQIERALQTVSKTPGALAYKRSFVCDQCGKIGPSLGVGPGRS